MTTASPIRNSAWPIDPSGFGTRASSSAPNASVTNASRRSVLLDTIQGVTAV
jgi:hypothetical protein